MFFSFKITNLLWCYGTMVSLVAKAFKKRCGLPLVTVTSNPKSTFFLPLTALGHVWCETALTCKLVGERRSTRKSLKNLLLFLTKTLN